jgi:hypothetical protein
MWARLQVRQIQCCNIVRLCMKIIPLWVIISAILTANLKASLINLLTDVRVWLKAFIEENSNRTSDSFLIFNFF